MRILVFGAGAVGQAVGCMLAAHGHNVDLITRERFIEKIKADGLTVSGIFGDYFAEEDKLGLYTTIEDISGKAFDGRGNYSFGIQEQIVFAEIDYDKIDTLRGMDITITTTARTDEEARALLTAFNFPIKKPEQQK